MKVFVTDCYIDLSYTQDFAPLVVHLLVTGPKREMAELRASLRAPPGIENVELEPLRVLTTTGPQKQGNRVFDVAEQRYVADCTTNEAAEAALRLLK